MERDIHTEAAGEIAWQSLRRLAWERKPPELAGMYLISYGHYDVLCDTRKDAMKN